MIRLSLVALLASSGALHAGPDATTNYFINNSPSILDFAIHKIEVSLNRNEIPAFVFYDWEADRIKISYSVYADKRTAEEAGDVCPDFVESIRRFAGIDDGKVASFMTTSYFSSKFSHEGYVTGGKEESSSRLEKLDKKFVIYCASGDSIIEAPLIGTGYSVKVKE
jgi:hypothetical protein